MKFQVEKVVLFDADLSTLTHIETEECISLTMSQSMLLELILSSKSEILSRDTIIDELWRRYGANNSIYTLNQYISLLRKLFSHFGINELIITVPRVGLKLNPDVLVTVYQTENKPNNVYKDEDKTSFLQILFFKLKCKKVLIGTLSFLVLSSVIVIILFFFQKEKIKSSFSFFNDKGCEIGLAAHTSLEDRNLILTQVREIIAENKLKCSNERIAYFDFSKSTSGQDYGRSILAFCTIGDDKEIISCENYYYRNWRVQ